MKGQASVGTCIYKIYWIGHKVYLGFPIATYRKTLMNFLASPIMVPTD